LNRPGTGAGDVFWAGNVGAESLAGMAGSVKRVARVRRGKAGGKVKSFFAGPGARAAGPIRSTRMLKPRGCLQSWQPGSESRGLSRARRDTEGLPGNLLPRSPRGSRARRAGAFRDPAPVCRSAFLGARWAPLRGLGFEPFAR
jgi:hypothetical protein